MKARAILAGLAAAAVLGPLAASAQAGLPPIYHVYVIVLENQDASTTFGAHSPAPYLSKTLRARGAYLPHLYGIGHESLDNYIALVSGQAPNAETQGDCQLYSDFPATAIGSYGQQAGQGCIYPSAVPTIADQLEAAGLTWRERRSGFYASGALAYGSGTPATLRRAMAYGTVVASMTVEGFGLDRLRRTGRDEIDGRLEEYRQMLLF